MKKKGFGPATVIIVLVLVFTGCGKTEYFEKNETVEVKEEAPSHNENAQVIEQGQTAVVKDHCEISLDYICISRDVKPKNPGSSYSQYSADTGKVYVDLCVAYKNLDTSAISAYDTMKCTLVYSEKYEYAGFSMMETDDRGDFAYSKNASISPLATEFIHYLFEVPDEVRIGGGSIDVYVTIGDSDFRVKADASQIDMTESETHPGADSVEIKEKQVVVTENAEFSINGARVTNDVVPSSPGDYYAHFEAEPGKLIVDMTVLYQNTSNTKIGVDSIGKSTLVLADRYEYTGFVVAEKSDGSEFTDADATSILPLEMGTIHHLFMVPEQIKTTGDPVYICFMVDGNEYKYVMR